mmetsp:Transcript_3153/g.5179  ORF Transcript_3153/g.5179 Transcript_3153/m.5179 type:complete len:418 (-) Transcript_3153:327-1580(-)
MIVLQKAGRFAFVAGILVLSWRNLSANPLDFLAAIDQQRTTNPVPTDDAQKLVNPPQSKPPLLATSPMPAAIASTINQTRKRTITVEPKEDAVLVVAGRPESDQSPVLSTTSNQQRNRTTSNLRQKKDDDSIVTKLPYPPQGGDSKTDAVVVSWKQQPKKPPLFFVWLGSNEMQDIHRAAIESCTTHNQNTFEIKVVRDDDLLDDGRRLGLTLHPLFHLLDHVQKSDYLRGELLHVHGGIYLDADVFCLRSLEPTLHLLEEGKVLGGGSPLVRNRNDYHNLMNNMMGPYLKNSTYTRVYHEMLWTKMEELRPLLMECLEKHPDGNGGISYPKTITLGKHICETKWGELIDFMKDTATANFKTGTLVNTFKACQGSNGEDVSSCDLLHVGCQGKQNCIKTMCQDYPILRKISSMCAGR